MNLLFSNDTRGAYPDSWYAATVDPLPEMPPVGGDRRADVCVVGAGFTGLSAALHLAEQGADVVVLDAHRVGWGASGRNGGQLGSGQRVDQVTLEQRLGPDIARTFWDLGEDAKTLVRELVARHAIDCALKPGVAWAATAPAEARALSDYAAHMQRAYGYDVEALDREAMQALCPSPQYCGGVLDRGAWHLHPLAFALGLARAALAAGVRIHERSWVTRLDQGTGVTVHTDAGRVRADTAILAANGYLGGLSRPVAARVMPINNFIVATEPLGPRTAEVLTEDVAVSDDRFVINYFRLSDDGRLLFGGGESYGYRFPRDIRALVRKPLEATFPQLRGIALEFAWGGTLAITRTRLPHLARVAPNILSASGYSGHGIGNAVQAGQLLAEAVRGQSAGFDAFAALPTPPFPGGSALRSPLLALAMTWFTLRDRLGL